MRIRTGAALAALAFGPLVACDTRRQPSGLDGFAPTIAISVDAPGDSVDITVPMQVSVDARDDLSLKRIVIAVDGVVAFDTTFTSATPRFERTIGISLAGFQSGSEVDVEAAAIDGANNQSDIVGFSVTAFDPAAP